MSEDEIRYRGGITLIVNSVVTNFLFAHQTDILADETKAATLRNNGNELLKGININKHFPWFPDFLESLPLAISKPLMPPGLIDMLSLFDVSYDSITGQCIVFDTDVESSCRAARYHEV